MATIPPKDDLTIPPETPETTPSKPDRLYAAVKSTTFGNCTPASSTMDESPSPGKKGDAPKKKGDDSKKMGQMKISNASVTEQVTAFLTKSAAPQQLAIGSVAGWTAGYLTMKISRPAAFVVGGSIVLFQIAQHTGYVKMDWNEVQEKVTKTSKQISNKINYVEKSPQWRANISRFAGSNKYLAAGFVGGFLMGMAT